MSDARHLITRLEKYIKDYEDESVEPTKISMLKKIASGFRGILPRDIKAYLTNLEEYSEDIPLLFHGVFWPFTLEEIAHEYDGVAKSNYFREYYITDEYPTPETTLDQPSPVGLRVSSTLDLEFSEDGYEEVYDMKRVIPLFQGESNYNLVLFLNSAGTTELAVQEQDFALCSIAPSLIEHIRNIREGLDSGQYREDQWSVEMPMYWYERVQAVKDMKFGKESWTS